MDTEKFEKENDFAEVARSCDPRDAGEAGIMNAILAVAFEVAKLNEKIDYWATHLDQKGISFD